VGPEEPGGAHAAGAQPRRPPPTLPAPGPRAARPRDGLHPRRYGLSRGRCTQRFGRAAACPPEPPRSPPATNRLGA
jgi:hypothetical protein